MGGKGERGDGKGGKGDRDREKGAEKGKKGEKGGEKGEKGGKGGKDGEKGGKGKSKTEKVIGKRIRGKVILLMADKPSGFIQRNDGDYDVFFDLASVLDNETVELYDQVEFDTVEWEGRLYALRVKKLPKDAAAQSSLQPSETAEASKKGSLTGGGFSLGGMTLGPGGAKPGGGKLTGGLSLRPGGAIAGGRPGGALGAGALGGGKKKEEEKKDSDENDGPEESEDGVEWGRVVSVQASFGFLKRLGASGEKSNQDVFFRAKDVVGMNGDDPGRDGVGLQISLPHGRMSHGYTTIWLAPDDEVSYIMSKDHTGKLCATDVRKEKKGAWRTGRRALTGPRPGAKQVEPFKDKVKRLCDMETDQVLQNVSLFKEVLEHEFCSSHLDKVVSLLARPDLAEDTRAEHIYRLFMNSIVFGFLRTSIIKLSAGKHCGTFLEECLRVFVEVAYRNPSEEIRDKMPLEEMVEAWESNVREGSSSTSKGVPEEVKHNLEFLQKQFPDKNLNLQRIFGGKQKRQNRSAAEDYTELLEADNYQDMPILPTSAEMLGQCAFEIQENMRTYDKCEDFVQTHFMLLREDYIEPLRAGINLFMQGKHSPKDLHVYTGVKVVGVLSTWEGLVYRIAMPKSQTRHIKWDKSKQLMYGSLLCFSDDNFETLIWATVWRRDEALMATEAQLDIRLPFETYDDRLAPGRSFCCIENVTIYFEAYRHVLIALQSMRPQDVPFQHTLLSPQPEASPPTFLKPETDMFNFHNVFFQCEKEGFNAPKTFKILGEWPESLQTTLDIDPSQLDAIQHALTHQVALVQGPPGTGKTWVGLRIVQALLDNTRGFRHSPILVVCYTNHALDQFLEGIFKFCERITRIGSRSNSEIMRDRNLKELVFGIQPSREYLQARRMLNERRDTLRAELARCLKTIDKHLVDLEDVQDLMTEKQFEEFFQGYLEYLGDDAKKEKLLSQCTCADDVDDKLWEKMMAAWLDQPDKLEKLVPLAQKGQGGLPQPGSVAGLEEEEEEERKKNELEKDAEEEEADQEKYERKLDVEQTEPKQTGDFMQELSYAWLPYMEDHYEALSPELRSMDWSQEDLWRMPRAKRKETYRQWLLEAHHQAREQLPGITHQLERNADNRAALERDRKLAVLREMEIVGMTTTAVSKYQVLLKELRPEVVIVEEAAEVLEAHILTALHPKTQHVILIGDHQQLRPSTAVYRLSKNFHLDVSLFERLIKNGADHVTLLQQRRMHPSISRLVRPLYPQLRDHKSTLEYPEIMGVNARCFFLRHRNLEDSEGESHSKANTFEANFISAFVAHLVKSGYEEERITVLSPYLGQVRLLKNKLRRDPTTLNVQITAVDNFQGEENDIIIISLVRSNMQKSMGFLAVDNRINVALTRARHGMFIVGNADMLRGHKLWNQIMEELGPDMSDELPLKHGDGTLGVRNCDDISVLLDDPIHKANGEGETGAFRPEPHSRWAGLGERDSGGSERRGKGKGRDRDDRDRRGGKGGERDSWERGGGGGRWDDHRDRGKGGGRFDDGPRRRSSGGDRDFRDLRDRDEPRMSLDEYRRGGKRGEAKEEEEDRGARGGGSGGGGGGRGEADEAEDAAKAGKKQNKKGNQVVLRMGGGGR